MKAILRKLQLKKILYKGLMPLQIALYNVKQSGIIEFQGPLFKVEYITAPLSRKLLNLCKSFHRFKRNV